MMTNSVLNLIDKYVVKANCPQPPGPPPRSGLEWNDKTCRWIRPGQDHPLIDYYDNEQLKLEHDKKRKLEVIDHMIDFSNKLDALGLFSEKRNVEDLFLMYRNDGTLSEEKWQYLIDTINFAKLYEKRTGVLKNGKRYIKGKTKLFDSDYITDAFSDDTDWSTILDAWEKENSAITKNKIAEELGERLKGNEDILNLYKYFENNNYLNYEQSGPEASTAAILIHQWAVSSADSNPLSIALQDAVYEEFNLTNASNVYRRVEPGEFEVFKNALRAFIRAEYEYTQEFFKKNNVTHVSLFRGFKFNSDDEIGRQVDQEIDNDKLKINDDNIITVFDAHIRLQPASSFSANAEIAAHFAKSVKDANVRIGDSQMVMFTRVSVENILATCQTGVGCKDESEMIVLGDILPVRSLVSRDTKPMNFHEIYDMMEGFNDN